MSRTYKTAERLKKNILVTAARCFNEHGYDKTTFQMMAEQLGISQAAIAYHYKIKPWITYRLFEYYMGNINGYVKENIDGPFDYYKYHCTAHLYLYREVLSDKRNRSLIFHKDHVALWEQECMGVIEGLFREIAVDFKKNVNEYDIRAIALMHYGAVLTLVKDFEKAPRDVDTLCKNMLYLMGALINLDEAAIQRSITYAFDFTYSHPLLSISLFAVQNMNTAVDI